MTDVLADRCVGHIRRLPVAESEPRHQRRSSSSAAAAAVAGAMDVTAAVRPSVRAAGG